MGLEKDFHTEGLQWERPHRVVAAKRLRQRWGWPGVIKVEFGSVRDKVDVLCKKQRLKSNKKFLNVHI